MKIACLRAWSQSQTIFVWPGFVQEKVYELTDVYITDKMTMIINFCHPS